jgi:hypothetical protein
MNETSAIEVTLLQAFETAQPASPNWTADDSAWATRLASASAEWRDAEGSNERFIAQRAHHAVQRLLPRETGTAKWLSARASVWPWLLVIVAAALLLGLLADSIGSAQSINLLAPPLWAVVLWNALVYALLMGQWMSSWFQREAQAGALSRGVQKLMRWGSQWPTPASNSAASRSPALQNFAALWMQRSAALSVTRAAVLLHAGAAALAVGLVAGMYLRGLVLDYRASWQSTFLSAETAHAALSFLLSPAAAAAHIPLPNVAAFEALRETHRSAQISVPSQSASGSAWIHLYAVTLSLFVVVPRLALALWSAARARWMAQHINLPMGDEYFARLLRQQQGSRAKVVVLPYASTPSAAALVGLRAVLTSTLGSQADVRVTTTVAFGDEDEAAALLPAGSTSAIALFDLSATPEAENQGRFAQHLASTASTVVMVDETAFDRRFSDAPQRLTQRRAAWLAWAKLLGTEPVFVHLEQPDLKTTERDLLAALTHPVHKLQA